MGGPPKRTQWGWVGQASLNYQGAMTTVGLAFSHRLVPATGDTSGPSNQTSVTANLTYLFTDKFSGNFSLGYFYNKSPSATFGIFPIDEQTFYIRPGVRYDFTKDLSLDISSRFVNLNNRAAHTEVDGWVFMINLTYRYPIFE